MLIGVAADFGTPWGQILGGLCVALGIAFVVFILICLAGRLIARRAGTKSRIAQLSAVFAVHALVGLLILAPLLGVQKLLGAENGLLAEYAEPVRDLQSYLDIRFDRLEQAITVLNEGVATQTAAVEEIGETMSFSVAMDIMDRVRQRRDGANQGQALAMRTLAKEGFDFIGSDFSGVSFQGVNMDGVDFTNARLHFADMRGASMIGTSFRDSGLRLAMADAESNFEGADLSGTYALLMSAPGARFAGADLSTSNFHMADLQGADLSGADLSGAAFLFADLRDADLSGANLTGAHFISTLMTGVTLDDAIFGQTNMLGAVLNSANVTPQQLAATCRFQIEDPFSYMHIYERWRSDRFSSGYEYDNLTEYDGYVDPGNIDDLSLPVCDGDPESAVAFNAAYPLSTSFNLDREYLDQAGRRASALARFRDMRQRLYNAYEEGEFFVSGGFSGDTGLDMVRVEVEDRVRGVARPRQKLLE